MSIDVMRRGDRRLPATHAAVAPFRKEWGGLAFGSVAAIIWGGYIAVTYHGVGARLNAADLAFLRYSVAGLLMLPWLVRHRRAALAGVGWMKGGVLALLAGPAFVLVGASGFAFAPLAHSAVIQLGSVTLMGIVLSALIARERQSTRRLLGLAVIIAGLAVTAGPGLLAGGSEVWKGDLLFATAGTMWAMFTVLQRRWGVSALAATATVSVLSGAVYSPLYILRNGLSHLISMPPMTLIVQAVVLGVLSGVVAMFAFTRAAEDLGPGRASLFPALAPAIAVLLGIPLSGEMPTTWQILGLATLSAGLLIAVQTRPAPDSAERRLQRS